MVGTRLPFMLSLLLLILCSTKQAKSQELGRTILPSDPASVNYKENNVGAVCPEAYPNPECDFYPTTDYECSQYIGGNRVYNYTLINYYNREIEETFNLVRVILGESTCASFLFLLMCNHMFPQCLPLKTDGNGVATPQKICKETCNLLHEDICKENLNGFGKMVLRFESITLDIEIRSHMADLLINKCNDSLIFPSKKSQPEPECFTSKYYVAENKSQTCHSNGYQYQGSLRKTASNQTCKPWTVLCNDTHLLDMSMIINKTENYCRNPGGYRDMPWCYIDEKAQHWEYCDVEKCPVIHGGYSEWTTWSECRGTCDNEFYKTRQRNCTNPEPKYGGNNCSRFGNSFEMMSCGILKCKDKTVLIYGVIGGSVSAVLLVITALGCYVRKRCSAGDILQYSEVDLGNAENIRNLMMQPSTSVELVENIYQSLKTYTNRFCAECIKMWLVELVRSATELDGKQKQSIINESLKRLEICRVKQEPSSEVGIACKAHQNHAHFREETVIEWLCNTVTYSRLDKEVIESRSMHGVLKIEGFLINSVYDKLRMFNESKTFTSTINLLDEGDDSPMENEDINTEQADIMERDSLQLSSELHELPLVSEDGTGEIDSLSVCTNNVTEV